MSAETIDPAILIPRGVVGKATNYPEFYDAVIAAINDHAALIDGGGSSSRVVFSYTANGSETDTIAITMPSTRASENYAVTPSIKTTGNILGMATHTYTTGGFQLLLTSPPAAGDVFFFAVEDVT